MPLTRRLKIYLAWILTPQVLISAAVGFAANHLYDYGKEYRAARDTDVRAISGQVYELSKAMPDTARGVESVLNGVNKLYIAHSSPHAHKAIEYSIAKLSTMKANFADAEKRQAATEEAHRIAKEKKDRSEADALKAKLAEEARSAEADRLKKLAEQSAAAAVAAGQLAQEQKRLAAEALARATAEARWWQRAMDRAPK